MGVSGAKPPTRKHPGGRCRRGERPSGRGGSRKKNSNSQNQKSKKSLCDAKFFLHLSVRVGIGPSLLGGRPRHRRPFLGKCRGFAPAPHQNPSEYATSNRQTNPNLTIPGGSQAAQARLPLFLKILTSNPVCAILNIVALHKHASHFFDRRYGYEASTTHHAIAAFPAARRPYADGNGGILPRRR